MKQHIVTHSDDNFDYGYSISEDEEKSSNWMKSKEVHWSNLSYSDIIKQLNIPINNEMFKQISKYEGDTHFLYKLYFMCKSEEIALTEKQIGFMIRLLMANPDVYLLALKHFAVSGLKAGKSNKEIETKLKEIQDKHL